MQIVGFIICISRAIARHRNENKGISLSKLSNRNIPYDTDVDMDNKLNNYLQIIGIKKVCSDNRPLEGKQE